MNTLSKIQTALLIFLTLSSCCYAEIIPEIIPTPPLLTKEQLLQRGNVPHAPFILNTIPKAGTHLIMECIYYMINKRVDEANDLINESNFTPAVKNNLLKYFLTLPNANYIHKTHFPHFPAMEKLFIQVGLKWIFVIRDPRDALISLAFYMEDKTSEGNRRDFMDINSSVYNQLSFDDKITALMTGSCCTNYLATYYEGFYGWTETKNGLVVKFEDLIGPNGGGTKERQLNTLRKISTYLNMNLSDAELLAASEYCYHIAPTSPQNSKVYKKAQMGSWKKFLSEPNKLLFKKLYAKKLILLGYEEGINW